MAKYSDELKAACVEEVRGGAKARDVARKYMLAEMTVARWAKAAGVADPAAKKKRKEGTFRFSLRKAEGESKEGWALYLGDARIAGAMGPAKTVLEFDVLPEVLRGAMRKVKNG